MNYFSKKEAIQFGWRATQTHFLFFVRLMVVVVFIFYGPAVIMQSFDQIKLPTLVSIFFFLVGIMFGIIQLLVSIGLIRISLAYADNHKVSISDLFQGGRFLIPYFLITLLLTVFGSLVPVCIFVLFLLLSYVLPSFVFIPLVVAGGALMLIGIVVLTVRFQFAPYIVIDKRKGPFVAIKESWSITRGLFWNLAIFGIALFVLNLLGALALLVGLLWTIPTSLVAMGFVYRRLSQRTHA